MINFTFYTSRERHPCMFWPKQESIGKNVPSVQEEDFVNHALLSGLPNKVFFHPSLSRCTYSQYPHQNQACLNDTNDAILSAPE